MKKKINVNCPHCQKKFFYFESEARPFCSEKCKMIDLGGWLSESYNIPGTNNSIYIENPELLEQLMSESNETY